MQAANSQQWTTMSGNVFLGSLERERNSLLGLGICRHPHFCPDTPVTPATSSLPGELNKPRHDAHQNNFLVSREAILSNGRTTDPQDFTTQTPKSPGFNKCVGIIGLKCLPSTSFGGGGGKESQFSLRFSLRLWGLDEHGSSLSTRAEILT